ncbi:MAG: histidinol-phosphate/aromatic aminotransferase and cobyric acid decarboxylase [Rhodospirillales bacterium CG15_BIG_FIL_POST_REV_8_21_14_020_66_15]|nr:MAG: histidinol-phosphate/aromatic aminotransferase and cobyric acid decarboxylase [Rhodospirillales bacterium CG15_BIG_FIL_POST_REV_8_21_14_020_66_15]
MTKSIPVPRPGVRDESLVRPDWTSQAARSKGALWLDRNENIDPALAEVTTGVLRALDGHALYTYPDLGALYAKLARSLGTGGADQHVLAAGSDGAIRATFEAFVSPGDVVIHTAPTFAMYSVYARMYAADARPAEYLASDDGPYLDAEALIGAIASSSPRLVCLPNPDSPTGTVVDAETRRRIVSAAGRAGAVMLIDEAYFPFHPETAAAWVLDHPHLIVTRSFGKAWGLAGCRVGLAVAHPDMARILHKVRPMYEIGALSANVLENMLDHADAVAASVARINEGKDWFVGEMRALGYKVLPGHGNFMHVAFGADGPGVHAALADRVLYRRDFPNSVLAGYSRFSMAPKDIMEEVAGLIRAAA